MIIACPHCQTKYQVTFEAIGSAGRKVQCAHCQRAWKQAPLNPDEASAAEQAGIEAIVEDELDEALAAEERAVAAELARRLAEEEARHASEHAAKPDAAQDRKRQRAFSKRQDAIAASQPLARFRRAVRVGLSLLLCALLAGAYFARVELVTRYPALAGAYEAVGLGVNVVGLDFSNLSTQRTIRAGKDVLVVSAQIVGLNATPTAVPQIVVTLLDGKGQGIYAWSIAPAIGDLMAGERATFDTQLVMPPGDAARVRLAFAEAEPASGGAAPEPIPNPPGPAAAQSAPPHSTPTPEHH